MTDVETELDPATEAARTQAGLVALFGEQGYATLEQWLKSLLAGTVPNPAFYYPRDMTPYPEHVAITVYVKTNRPELPYDVRVYKHPDLVNPILPYYTNVATGAPKFGVEFPAFDLNYGWVFEAGNTYRFRVQVSAGSEPGNTDFIDIPIVSSVPLVAVDENGIPAASNGTARRAPARAIAKGDTTVMKTKAVTRSKK